MDQKLKLIIGELIFQNTALTTQVEQLQKELAEAKKTDEVQPS